MLLKENNTHKLLGGSRVKTPDHEISKDVGARDAQHDLGFEKPLKL